MGCLNHTDKYISLFDVLYFWTKNSQNQYIHILLVEYHKNVCCVAKKCTASLFFPIRTSSVNCCFAMHLSLLYKSLWQLMRRILHLWFYRNLHIKHLQWCSDISHRNTQFSKHTIFLGIFEWRETSKPYFVLSSKCLPKKSSMALFHFYFT